MMLPIFKTSLPGLLDDLLKEERFSHLPLENAFLLTPAVNIIEGDTDFTIEVAAPGFEKEDFKIKLENKTLTISSEKNTGNVKTERIYKRREFNISGFQRTFSLPESADGDSISAVYEKGILNLTIPKKEEAKVKPVRQIEVA